MATLCNFQINPEQRHNAWEDVPVISVFLPDWQTAVKLAKQSAKLFRAEVRLTQGMNPLTKSGSYFHHRAD